MGLDKLTAEEIKFLEQRRKLANLPSLFIVEIVMLWGAVASFILSILPLFWGNALPSVILSRNFGQACLFLMIYFSMSSNRVVSKKFVSMVDKIIQT
ncbi:MAG: hypothetical protein WCI27_06630 [Candidatus Omnitrophota bacterium]